MSLNLIESNQFIFLVLPFFLFVNFLFLSLLRLVVRIYLFLVSLAVVVAALFLFCFQSCLLCLRVHTLFTQYTRTKKHKQRPLTIDIWVWVTGAATLFRVCGVIRSV